MLCRWGVVTKLCTRQEITCSSFRCEVVWEPGIKRVSPGCGKRGKKGRELDLLADPVLVGCMPMYFYLCCLMGGDREETGDT